MTGYHRIIAKLLTREYFSELYARAVIFTENARKGGDRTFFMPEEKREYELPNVAYVLHISPDRLLLDCHDNGEKILMVLAVGERLIVDSPINN